MAERRRVAVLVFEGVKLLDVAGPSEVFSEATRLGADYEVMLVSPDGRDVTSSTGMRMAVDGAALTPLGAPSQDTAPIGTTPPDAGAQDTAPIGAAPLGAAPLGAAPQDTAPQDTVPLGSAPLDTVLVAGGDLFPTHPVDAALADAARNLAGRSRRTASICTGAFVLAAAGLLDGRRATTHWEHATALARSYPAIEVEPDAIFVEDGTVFSSAGVSAGIDLALAMVEQDHGPELARDVARSLVVYLQRPGGQSQFSPSMRAPLPRTTPLRAVCDRVAAAPAGNYSLPRLAEMAAVSPRQLTRLFREELRTTPAKYVELVRLNTAKDLLDAGEPVTDTAYRSGFGSPESMRRSFIQHLGIAPRSYQRRFRSALRR
jgi:transcriptional regulator GlxA family with amidase domain